MKWIPLFLWCSVGLCGEDAFRAAPDCEKLDCTSVLPGAVRFRDVAGAPYVEGLGAEGERLGWLILSPSVTDQKGYSGKPLVTLVGLDPSGRITGARVVHHSEPILLVGIPEQKLTAFTDFYAGKPATVSIVVGAAQDPETLSVDAISGATVTALVQNKTILDTARELGIAVGVIEKGGRVPGEFLETDEVWSWRTMEKKGVFGHLEVSEAEMGHREAGSAPFIDLYFALADAPQVGKALIGPAEYAWLKTQLQEGEHLLVVFGRGSGSFKGSGFVRGGIFDRIRVEQGLASFLFRDRDYHNLSKPAVSDAPAFKEGAVFIARGLDPGRTFKFIFLASRYDGKGGFSREFQEFQASYRLPRKLYRLSGPDPESQLWRQAWANRKGAIAVELLVLLAILGFFIKRNWLTGSLKRLQKVHYSTMLVSCVVLGFALHIQPSVTQVLTFVGSLTGEWRMGLFLSEPTLFIMWIFIAIVTVVWGRGVFCGWVCPFGSLSELLFIVARKLGLPSFELPEPVHRKLRWLRYITFLGLIPVYLVSPELGELMAEVEPFKTAFLVVPWTRAWGFLAWWLLLLVLSVFWYRPFCRYLCPLGAGLALPSSFRLSGPRRRNFCSSCKICTKGCEPMAIREDGVIDSRECLNCMECEANFNDREVCPPLAGLDRLAQLPALNEHQLKKRKELETQSWEV